jgi:hypothetical protein
VGIVEEIYADEGVVWHNADRIEPSRDQLALIVRLDDAGLAPLIAALG